MTTLKNRFAFDIRNLISFCKKCEITESLNISAELIEIKKRDLDARWVKVETSFEELMLSDLGEDVKAKVQDQYDSCTDVYYETISKILDIIRACKASEQQPANDVSITKEQSQELFNSGLKLRPCDTQVFAGGYEDWPPFRDMFTAVYINHPRLTPAEILYHLRNKTTAAAEAIVKRFPLTDENFNLAWQALKLRYENNRVLVDNQIRTLFNLPAAISENSETLQEIHSSLTDCLAMLQTLGVSCEGWDPMLVNLVYSKLPSETLAQWEQSLNASKKLPKWSQLSDFLLKRCEVVERISTIKDAKVSFQSQDKAKAQVQMYSSQEKFPALCKICDEEHSLRTCAKFRKFTIQERVDFVFKHQFCNNCLSATHFKTKCKSKNTCLNCGKRHHTLLHMRKVTEKQPYERKDQNSPTVKALMNSSEPQQSKVPETMELPSTSKACKAQINSNYAANHTNILLRTAVVQILLRGELFTIRALIDPGSERTFLSERIQNRLNIPSRKSLFEILGVGGQSQTATKECDFTLASKKGNFQLPISAIVLPKVTNKIPSASFAIINPSELSEIDLADPSFNVSSPIDLILGNDYERYINLEGVKRDVCGTASAYNTVFGWVLSGPVSSQPVYSFSTRVFFKDDLNLDSLIRKFWEQEECPATSSISAEDEYCEEFYTKTTKRQADGRYMVKLPFRKDFPDSCFLGPSRFVALSQYTRMEKTLTKNPSLNVQYNEVLSEYLSLDHMEETTSKEYVSNDKCNSFYLPHHAIIRPESRSTKVRVVFNASRKTKSGYSLNDVLYTGPTLQADLMTVILNWRFYKYVYSGDIQKMYRQILIDPSDRPFQRILFQKTPREAIKDYQLKTVTFGLNCAPFLAIRTLLQLASDSQSQFPKASAILRRETYVDDILTGGHSIETALEAQSELIQSLKSAGFLLKKICSNDSRLLHPFPIEDLYDSDFLKFYNTSAAKTLGIRWNALTDSFTYAVEAIQVSGPVTKRQVLSSVAKLYDPAGWITPVIVKGKVLIQQLWLERIDWDDPISADSLRLWTEIVNDLPKVEKFRIPRWIQFTPENRIQIHGFCDASKLAYCAAVYIRTETTSPVVLSNLLVSKSKVAPLASTTLPRLELCGAVLLAKLVQNIKSSLNLIDCPTVLWCDSSIVLGWLAKPPATWKEIYVSNRVAQIHKLIPTAKWRYVPTHSNPADIGSRGCRPQELADNILWWMGPQWFTHPETEWPKFNPTKMFSTNSPSQSCDSQSKSPDLSPITSLQTSTIPVDILKNFSSYTRALRVLAYVFRYIRHFRRSFGNPSFPLYYASILLSHEEVTSVKTRLIILAQQNYYPTEYVALFKAERILKSSSLHTLNPFLDKNGILRANGRLANSLLPYKERFPIILPRDSYFFELFLKHLHEFLAHGECNLMCRMIQTEFYIIRLKLRVRKIIRYCKTCIIHKRKSCTQIMAALPSDRCTLSLPFHTTGVDFAGPFDLKSSPLRKAPILKGYACIFVCFATKAVHLEACFDLSASAFRATFTRFVGRRGLPHNIVSDNGRNFVGASRHLRKEFRTFINTVSSDISEKYVTHGFEWSFIPPHAPHMGGLWEAAVKSFKFHLKRVAGAQRFTFEEFLTLLARIEGVLNSRPISPLSESPHDLTALTPGHFLRGGPLLAFPEPFSENISLISRWEKLKAIHHQFALRWKEEYLKSLHKRYKWKFSVPNLEIGDFVVVIDDLLPPSEWRLGRVEAVHRGSDTRTRVVDVRTASGVIKRPIAKLCYLPYNKSTDFST